MRLADVALPVPLARALTYEVPPALVSRVVAGARVVCPLGGRRVVGVVIEVRDGDPPPGARLRPVAQVVGDEPSVPADLLAFLVDLARYYFAPIGEVVRLALPPVEREVARAIAEPDLFTPSRGIGPRTVQWVEAVEGASSDAKISPRGIELLERVRTSGPAPLARLEVAVPGARTAVKRLVSLGLARIEAREAPHDPFFAEPTPRDVPPALTPAQEDATTAIVRAIAEHRATTFLLHGVTGSGKTEVYLRAIAAAREAKIGTVVLVPEIALTPQLVSRFRARFGDDVAVLHSGLTPKERLGMWRRLHEGEVDVAIGARSALFAPVRNLGLVVVDEEHDPSFKQEEGVRYHARDMAILRAHRVGGVCILGSATPSLESEHLAMTGRATKLLLPDRTRAQTMPKVEIVDLRRIGAGPTGDKRLSLPLHRALDATLLANEQAILFLNRRGFAPSVRCESCGEMSKCTSCSVALTFHKGAGAVLRCHTCDHEEPMFACCKKCGSTQLVLEGLGTEKLEESLVAAFPTARVARLDRDVASGRAIEAVLERMRAREIDILVGTQMVTKGHDLPSVTLVGVINADAALSIPDFRAAERGFQLLVQVAGRAGRGDVPGRVLIQTYDPEQDPIVFAARHDVDGFLAREMENRRELLYPPFSRMALVRVDGPDESEARAAAQTLHRAAILASERAEHEVDVKEVTAAPIARIRARWRFRVVLRSTDRPSLRRVLAAVDRARESLPRSVRATLDIDPVQLL